MANPEPVGLSLNIVVGNDEDTVAEKKWESRGGQTLRLLHRREGPGNEIFFGPSGLLLGGHHLF